MTFSKESSEAEGAVVIANAIQQQLVADDDAIFADSYKKKNF